MTFNADAALGPTGAGTPPTAINLVGGVFGRVLADRAQHPVQYDAQRIQIIIGQWVEEQLSDQRDVVGCGLLDGSSARGAEANDRAAGVVFAELPDDKAPFEHSGDLMRGAAAIPPKGDAEILGPQLPVRGPPTTAP